jgi:transcriptional regulator with XRE-family HTH domain
MEDVDSVATQVDGWILRSTLTQAEIALRAGVNASTVHRIRRGMVDPSIATLRDIAIACGYSIDVVTRPLSDSLAAEAARSLLEEGFAPTHDVSHWTARLQRNARSPQHVLRRASDCANPLARPGARHFAGPVTTGLLASAGTTSGGEWMVSGSPGLTLPPRQEELDGHAILWVTAPENTNNLIGASLRSVPHAAIAQLTVLPASTWIFQNSFEHEFIHYAAPIQIMIDCLALGGSTSQRATEIIGEW